MLAALDSNTKHTVYVHLLNEGTPVLRPVPAFHLRENIYQLLPTEGYDSEDEEWEFLPNTVVRCEEVDSEGENILVAIQKV